MDIRKRRILNLIMFGGVQKEASSVLYGDSYWVNYRDSTPGAVQNTIFTSETNFDKVWTLNEELKYCIRIPSGQPSDESSQTKFTWRALDSTFIAIGTRDRNGVITTPPSPNFTVIGITDLDGNDLTGSALPYDTWMIVTNRCDVEGLSGDNPMTITYSGMIPLTKAVYHLRGATFGSEVMKASDIDADANTWFSSIGRKFNFTNSTSSPFIKAEVIDINV